MKFSVETVTGVCACWNYYNHVVRKMKENSMLSVRAYSGRLLKQSRQFWTQILCVHVQQFVLDNKTVVGNYNCNLKFIKNVKILPNFKAHY